MIDIFFLSDIIVYRKEVNINGGNDNGVFGDDD